MNFEYNVFLVTSILVLVEVLIEQLHLYEREYAVALRVFMI